MKKKIIIPIVTVVLVIIIGFVSFIIFNNNKKIVSTITLDINPSIEINLNKKEKVISVVALNDDANAIVNDNIEGKNIEEALGVITDNLIERNYAREDDLLEVILYSNGKITNKKVEEILTRSLKEKRIDSTVIIIDRITEEDEKLAKKYKVSPAKVSYIRSITKDNENINLEDLLNKQVKELKEIEETNNYCDSGYTLDNGWCFKEKERIDALKGSICPDRYVEYNGKCYKESRATESEQLTCREGFKLVDNDCVSTETHKAEKKCNNGELRGDKCLERTIIGEAYEFCRDPGRTLYNHKCLATKPAIDGGCLNGDMYLNGKCVNTKNDYYMAEWKCSDGKVKSNGDGTLLDNDTHCYAEKYTNDYSYTCEDSHNLVGDECTITYKEPPRRELICPNGNIKIDGDRCINQNDTKEKVDGYYCEGENNRLDGKKCVIYEMVEAKHN